MDKGDIVNAVASGILTLGGGAVIATLTATTSPFVYRILLWGGLILMAVAAVVCTTAFFWPAQREAPTLAGDTFTNNGTNNGIMGSVSIGKGSFQLTDDLVRQVVDACPPGLPVTVIATQSQRAFPMQARIVTALEHAGFAVKIDRAETVVVIAPNL